jgi:FkbM family methyltransferase
MSTLLPPMSLSHLQSLDSLLSTDPTPAMEAAATALRKRVDAASGKLVLAGAAVLGVATLKLARKAGLTPIAFTDNNPDKSGTQVSGVPVMTPAEAVSRFKNEALFVITVYTSEPLWSQFRQLGVDPVSFTRLSWAYPDSFLPYFGVDDPRIIPQNADEIRRAFEFWDDEASRIEYLAQLQWRTTLDPEVLGGQCPPVDCLFAPDLVALNDHESFVDCGAFDGDTVTHFLGRTGGKFQSIAAYEPDHMNFARLEKLVANLPGSAPSRVHLFPNALGSAPGRIRFDTTGTVESALGAGEGWVDVVTLDDTADAFAPTFVKMDIEGAEPDAIRGASRLIHRHQPIMAVCLYHATRYLWEIPAMLKELVPGYSLYLRRYSNDCWEQVCYAIPPHRSIAS